MNKRKFEGRWLPDSEDYRQTCLRLAQSTENMQNFKRDPQYIRYVGNDMRGRVVAEAFYQVVKDMLYCEKNDWLGNPLLHDLNGWKSAGTLRFMKVMKDVSQWDFNSVVEIGGGYGGQATVMKEARPHLGYLIIDIPEALPLVETYFATIGVHNVSMISTEDMFEFPEIDLVISDYCLSELDDVGVDYYINTVIKKAKCVYVTANSQGDRFKQLVDKLAAHFILDIQPEKPKTSHHENHTIMGIHL
jgi:hypothetical protein